MRTRSRIRLLLGAVLALALALGIAACEGDLEEADPDAADPEADPDEEPEPDPDDDPDPDEEPEPGVVTVMSAFTGDPADRFEESFAQFEEDTGIEVDYEPTADFDTVLPTRVEAGNPPDIALFPQPGLLKEMAELGDATPLDEIMDLDDLEDTIVPGFMEATEQDGQTYGLPMRLELKSLLWYPEPAFEEAGHEVPETQEELQDLEEELRADGQTPWCLGMEAGDATGWVGTDWVQEYLIKLHGAEAYDAWVEGELDFASDEVREAFEEFGRVWQTDDNVLGGTDGMLNLPEFESANEMFADPPNCWMTRQVAGVTGFFPDDVREDLDEEVGVTYFPSFAADDEQPVVAGGDFALLLNDTDEAREFMEFLAQPEFGEPWAAAGGWLSPNLEFDVSAYEEDTFRDLQEIAFDSDVVRFDASDQMPGAVGTGAFWDAIVEWVDGSMELDEALEYVDESWPE